MRIRSISILYLSVFVCLLTTFSGVLAEEKKLLLFARNTTFLPQIEEVLSNMRNTETGKKVFSSITNVNKWSINQLEEGEIDIIIRYYESTMQLRRRSTPAIHRNDALIDLIDQANCYMRIEVLEKLPLLEFQILISDSLPLTEKGEFKILISDASRYEGFVVDITEDDYMLALKNSIKRFFPICNRVPIVNIVSNKEIHDNGYYYFGVGREIILDASYSYDYDNRELEFYWEQVNSNDPKMPVTEKDKIPFVQSAKIQRLQINTVGEFWLSLIISDGIGFSDKRILKIRVIEYPRIVARSLHKIISKSCVFKKNVFTVPVQLITDKRIDSRISILSIQVKRRKGWFGIFEGIGPFGHIPIIEESYYPKLISKKCDSLFCKFDYVIILHGHAWSKFRYKIKLVAENEYIIGDTLELYVDYEGKSIFYNFELRSSRFVHKTDTLDFRKIYFGMNYTISLGNDFALTYGQLILVYDEDHSNILQSSSPPVYISINYASSYVAYYRMGTYNGIGFGMDLGKMLIKRSIMLEYVDYSRDWRSFSARVNFAIPEGALMISYLATIFFAFAVA